MRPNCGDNLRRAVFEFVAIRRQADTLRGRLA
jgi:hypothetical protein